MKNLNHWLEELRDMRNKMNILIKEIEDGL